MLVTTRKLRIEWGDCDPGGIITCDTFRQMEVYMRRLMLAATTFALLAAMPCARAASLEELEANKKTVAAFEDAALNQKDFAAASK